MNCIRCGFKIPNLLNVRKPKGQDVLRLPVYLENNAVGGLSAESTSYMPNINKFAVLRIRFDNETVKEIVCVCGALISL